MSTHRSSRPHPSRRVGPLGRALLTSLLVLMTVDPLAFASDRLTGQPFATRSPVIARHGMVCCAQPLAAQIGLDVLKEGGTAVDAAIAVNAALGLMEPLGCGVGGDLFVIGWDNEAGSRGFGR